MHKSLLDWVDHNLELKNTIAAHIQIKKFQKGQIIQYAGDIRTQLYFVRSGCLRGYTIDSKGKEHIFIFAPEGWVLSDMVNQITKEPTKLFFDAVEDSEVEILPTNLDEDINFSSMLTKNIGTDKLMKRIATLQHRILMLMSAPALERYEDFINTYPDLLLRVPQRMIASYLGITPQALSVIRRVRKNKTK